MKSRLYRRYDVSRASKSGKGSVSKSIGCIVLALLSFGIPFLVHYVNPSNGDWILYVVLTPIIAILILTGFLTTIFGFLCFSITGIVLANKGSAAIVLVAGVGLLVIVTLGHKAFWVLWGSQKLASADHGRREVAEEGPADNSSLDDRSEEECGKILLISGYNVEKRSESLWVITEPFGGRVKISSLEELKRYTQKRNRSHSIASPSASSSPPTLSSSRKDTNTDEKKSGFNWIQAIMHAVFAIIAINAFGRYAALKNSISGFRPDISFVILLYIGGPILAFFYGGSKH